MDISNLGLVAIGVYAVTEWFKRVQFFPVAEGQKARIRTVAGILAVIGAGLNAYLDGSWSEWVSSDSVQVLIQAGLVFVATWLGHKGRNIVEKLWKGKSII